MAKRFILLFLTLLSLSLTAEPLDRVVAVVNDNVITESELNNQISVLKTQMQSKGMQLPDEKVMRKQVLQHLIDVDLQLQMAKQNHMAVSSAEINDAIAGIARANHIDIKTLKNEIIKSGMSWKDYRKNIRREMMISRLQQKTIGHEVTISNQQVEDYLKTAKQNNKLNQTFHLENIVVPLSEEPTPEQINAARNKADALLKRIKGGEHFNDVAVAESSGEFALSGGDLGERHLAEMPEIYAKKVLSMKPGEVAGPIRAGNGFHLIHLVNVGGDKQQHRVKQTHVRHILIKSNANMTADEARKQSHNLYQQLKSGKDFGKMAKQHSVDAASAIKGGDLGWVGPGELVPEFETMMNSLPVNQISAPVKTVFGWHLIQVLERREIDDTAEFERQQIRQQLFQRKFAEAVENWQQHLRSLAFIQIMDKDLA